MASYANYERHKRLWQRSLILDGVFVRQIGQYLQLAVQVLQASMPMPNSVASAGDDLLWTRQSARGFHKQ